ncbi:A-kinase anchor protein 8-like [Melopsittacus undulatus]|uniref:A-kinase anchor protein 8-like n=1 Tax=Melopsittacus undulatus TaxID=13146 RepID=UPI00146A9CB2|nr:A-kinase anchor protein 8-like [Melopsittacus undulatus]
MSYCGYGDWNSGTNRGYEGYSYSYGYNQDNSGNYGYGMTTSNSWEVPTSDVDGNPDGSSGAEGAMGKVNQRLDMVSHMDTDVMQGAPYGSGDRFNSYNSYDSRPPMAERDIFHPGYDYIEAEPDTNGTYEGPYDAFYGNHRDQFQGRAREDFGQRGQSWGRDNLRPLGSTYPGRMSGQWNEAPQAMGSCAPHGSSRLPSLWSHNVIPEPGMFQGMRSFHGSYGAGMMKQHMRRSWKMWDLDYKPQRKKLRKDPSMRKQKLLNSSDDPKTDGSENSDSDNEEGTEGESGEKEEKEGSRGEGEEEEGKDVDKGALTIQEEIIRIKRRLQAGKRTPERQKKKHRDRMVERIQFVCSLCKYRTFYDDEMSSHLESKFHKEHFKFVGTKLPQQTAEFLQEYVANKTRKTEERRKAIEDINAVIQQIYRDQDLTQAVGMEHFIKKVEAAHCAACDLFIPMQYSIIQKHLKSLDHNYNRRAMMEQSKKSSLVVARSILNNKLISKKLERYLKGENPFMDDPEEKEEHEEGDGGASGNVEEGAAENRDEEENPEEENKEAKGNLEAEGAGNGGEQEETGTETMEAQAEMESAAGNVEEQNSLHPDESLPEEEEHQRVGDEQGSEEVAAAQEEEEDGD